MKKLFTKSIISGMVIASFGASAAGVNTDLEVLLSGTVTEQTCEPELIVDGVVVSNGVVNVKSVTAAEATNSNMAGLVGDPQQFQIVPSKSPTCTPTSASMFIKGTRLAGLDSNSVLKNTSDLTNMGMALSQGGSDVIINGQNTYDPLEDGGAVTFAAQMYHTDDQAVTGGLVTSPVTFVVSYQ